MAACATCLRSCSSRLRMEASSMELPTRTTMPPSTSGSTFDGELDLAAGLVADPVADPLDVPRRARRREVTGDRQQLVLSSHSASSSRADAEEHRHAVLLDQQLEEVDHRLVGAGIALSRPSFFSSVEKYGENRNTWSSRSSVERVGELAELRRAPCRACPAPWRPRTGSGRRPRRSPPWASAAPRRPPGR